MPPGTQFHAKLQNKVRLENGAELPAGTVLAGEVVNDDTQAAGGAKFALRFTEADLKSGQTIPIKATIVDVYHVLSGDQATAYGATEGITNWDHNTTVIDQIGVLSGVDLHSNIASPNSGVFVSTRKSDVKLSPGVGVELAIAARGNDQQEGNDDQQSISGTGSVPSTTTP